MRFLMANSNPAYRRETAEPSTICFVERQGPKAGDFIIKREASISRDHYSLREFPSVAQVSYDSLEIALDIATRLARSAGTDVWHEEDGHFGLIESR